MKLLNVTNTVLGTCRGYAKRTAGSSGLDFTYAILSLLFTVAFLFPSTWLVPLDLLFLCHLLDKLWLKSCNIIKINIFNNLKRKQKRYLKK